MWERRGIVWRAVDLLFFTCMAMFIEYLVLLRCLVDPNLTDVGEVRHCLALGRFVNLYMHGSGHRVSGIVTLPS